MSVSKPSNRPVAARWIACAALVATLAACGGKEEPAATEQPANTAATAAPTAPAGDPAASAELAKLGADELRKEARTAYQESRLYAPAGRNAFEYYLALRDKAPGDAGVSSALIDLMPMTVIATEQSRDREDFAEAKRLLALIEKADATHPALARLKGTIATSEQGVASRAEQQKLSAEQEAERQKQLQAEREKQQQQQQQQAAAQLVQQQQAEQQAATRAAEQQAATQRANEQRAAEQRAAEQRAATAAPATPAPAPAPAAASTELRALSTPSPRYPPDALRSGQSGEVQVEFTVGVDGSVSGARVVRATPPRVFDREALNAVRRWRFEPVGAPVTTRRTIGFNPGD